MQTQFGIDVSKWQASRDGLQRMDWRKAVDAGIEFAFVRATYGADYVDPEFAYNWQELRRLNVKRGAYHYFRPKQDNAYCASFDVHFEIDQAGSDEEYVK